MRNTDDARGYYPRQQQQHGSATRPQEDFARLRLPAVAAAVRARGPVRKNTTSARLPDFVRDQMGSD